MLHLHLYPQSAIFLNLPPSSPAVTTILMLMCIIFMMFFYFITYVAYINSTIFKFYINELYLKYNLQLFFIQHCIFEINHTYSYRSGTFITNLCIVIVWINNGLYIYSLLNGLYPLLQTCSKTHPVHKCLVFSRVKKQ